MRVGYYCINDPRTPTSFSGVPYFMTRALEAAEVEFEWIGLSLLNQPARRGLMDRLGRRLRSLGGPPSGSKVVQVLNEDIERAAADVLFAPMAAELLALTEPRLPVVYFSDATPRLMGSYYSQKEWASGGGLAQAEDIERRAISKCDRLIYTSEWAARSAVEHYGANESNIRIVPFGGNVDPAPAREDALSHSFDGELRLLFIASNFERKGGQVVLETLTALQAEGIPTRVWLVGDAPELDRLPEGAERLGWLDKSVPNQARRLRELMATSHFLMLPSQAETFGAVCSEANAFGLPVLASRTGGLAEAVRNGSNGLSFPNDADGAEYARAVLELWRQPGRYAELVRGARAEYDTRLSWSVIASQIRDVFRELV